MKAINVEKGFRLTNARTLALAAAFALLAIAAGALIPFVPAVVLGSVASLVAAVGLAAFRREQFPLSPLGPVILVLLTSAFIPAVLGFLDETPVAGLLQQDYGRAGLALLAFVVLALLIYMPETRAPKEESQPRGEHLPPEKRTGRLLLLWVGLAILAFFALGTAAAAAGGPDAYLDGLASRRVFFTGRAWIIWALVAPAIASLVLLGALGKRLTHERRSVVLVVGVVGLSLAFLVATGNRMNLVTYAASLAVVVNVRVRALRPATLLAGILVIGAIGLTLPNLLRPTDGDPSLSTRSLTTSLEDINRLGPVGDFGHLPSLALVMQEDSGAELQWGRTYLAAATIGVPRAILPDKLPTAGEVATKQLLPSLWSISGTAIQITSVGEGYLNFGWAGIVLAAVAFGFLLRLARMLERRRDLLAVLLYAVLLPRLALLLRGDFANVAGYLLMELSVLAVGLVLAQGWPRLRRSRSEQRAPVPI